MQGKFDKKLLVFLIIAFELTILDIATRILVIVSHELMAKRDVFKLNFSINHNAI